VLELRHFLKAEEQLLDSVGGRSSQVVGGKLQSLESAGLGEVINKQVHILSKESLILANVISREVKHLQAWLLNHGLGFWVCVSQLGNQLQDACVANLVKREI